MKLLIKKLAKLANQLDLIGETEEADKIDKLAADLKDFNRGIKEGPRKEDLKDPIEHNKEIFKHKEINPLEMDKESEKLIDLLNEPYHKVSEEKIVDTYPVRITDMSHSPELLKTIKIEANLLRPKMYIEQLSSHGGGSRFYVELPSGSARPDPEVILYAAYRQFGFGGQVTQFTDDKQGNMRWLVECMTLD